MKPIALLSGGSGWLGRRLLRSLTRGLADVPELADPIWDQIRCLVVSESDEAVVRSVSKRVTCVRGDMRDADSLDKFMTDAQDATLFNCAGLIHPRRVREFYRVNVAGTRHLLERASRAGVRRFIHVSSNSPVGFNPHVDHRFDEEAPYRPYLNYGKSKQQAEQLVRTAGQNGDLETVIIRPPWFYGPGQPARQTTFFSMVKNGKVPLVGGGVNYRSMAYVDNICHGLLLCAQQQRASGQIYWIADRRPYTMREIVDTVADVLTDDFAMEVKREQWILPDRVSEWASLADKWIQGLGLYHQKIHVLSEMNKNIACSIEKARRQLGYDPKIELREGMRRSVEDLMARGGFDSISPAAFGSHAG